MNNEHTYSEMIRTNPSPNLHFLQCIQMILRASPSSCIYTKIYCTELLSVDTLSTAEPGPQNTKDSHQLTLSVAYDDADTNATPKVAQGTPGQPHNAFHLMRIPAIKLLRTFCKLNKLDW